MISHESERLDFSKVPESKGIPTSAFIVLVIGLIGIFLMGGYSAYLSGYGHKWPANKTLRASDKCDSANAQTC